MQHAEKIKAHKPSGSKQQLQAAARNGKAERSSEGGGARGGVRRDEDDGVVGHAP